MTLEELIEHHGFPVGRTKAEAIADAIRTELADHLEYMRDDHDRSLIAAHFGVTS